MSHRAVHHSATRGHQYKRHDMFTCTVKPYLTHSKNIKNYLGVTRQINLL